MEEALSWAYHHREEIEITKLDKHHADLAVIKSRSYLLPQLSADGSLTYYKKELPRSPSPSRLAYLRLRQTLFDGTTFAAYGSNQYYARATGHFSKRQIQELLFEVAQAYFDVGKLEKLRQVMKEKLKLADQQLSVAEARYRSGEVPKTDLLQAKAEKYKAERDKLDVEHNSRYAKLLLSNYLGASVTSDPIEYENYYKHYQIFDEDLDSLVQKAWQHRQDLQGRQAEVQAYHQELAARKRQRWPTVSVEANNQWADPANSYQQNNFWTVAFTAEWPLWEGGKIKAEARQALSRYKQAALNYKKQKEDVRLQVSDAWLAGQTAIANIDALHYEVAFEEENYQAISQRYQLGQATNLDLQEAFHRFISAKIDLVNQENNAHLAAAWLSKEVGVFAQDIIREE
ncbi:MAG: TolC family protein [Chlamydiota bacterium]